MIWPSICEPLMIWPYCLAGAASVRSGAGFPIQASSPHFDPQCQRQIQGQCARPLTQGENCDRVKLDCHQSFAARRNCKGNPSKDVKNGAQNRRYRRSEPDIISMTANSAS